MRYGVIATIAATVAVLGIFLTAPVSLSPAAEKLVEAFDARQLEK